MTENTWTEHSIHDERRDLPDCCDSSGAEYASRYSDLPSADVGLDLDVARGTVGAWSVDSS